jgi:hypothetical protein
MSDNPGSTASRLAEIQKQLDIVRERVADVNDDVTRSQAGQYLQEASARVESAQVLLVGPEALDDDQEPTLVCQDCGRQVPSDDVKTDLVNAVTDEHPVICEDCWTAGGIW